MPYEFRLKLAGSTLCPRVSPGTRLTSDTSLSISYVSFKLPTTFRGSVNNVLLVAVSHHNATIKSYELPPELLDKIFAHLHPEDGRAFPTSIDADLD